MNMINLNMQLVTSIARNAAAMLHQTAAVLLCILLPMAAANKFGTAGRQHWYSRLFYSFFTTLTT
jgi:hypothetical protein